MSMMLRDIERLAPHLEVVLSERDDRYVVAVLRLADDGWAGWRVEATGATKQQAIKEAMSKVKKKILDEAANGKVTTSWRHVLRIRSDR
jgi:hypothetical protein